MALKQFRRPSADHEVFEDTPKKVPPVQVKKEEEKIEEQKKSEPQVKFAEPVVQQETKTSPSKDEKKPTKAEPAKMAEAQTFLKSGSYKVIQSDA